MNATHPTAAASARDQRPAQTPFGRADWLALAVVFGVALALRLLHLQQVRLHDPFFGQPSPDPQLYYDWALEIARGNWLGEGVFLQGPLLPYLLALGFRLFGPGFGLPLFIQCILGSASCVLIYALAREIFDRRVAVIASAMFAVYGMGIFYGGSLLIANLLVPLNLMILYSALQASRAPSPATWATLGIWTALAILARPNMLLYVPFVLAWGAWLCWDASDAWRAGWRRWVSLAMFAVTVGLCLSPSLVRNGVVADDWVLVSASAGMNFYNGNNPDANGTHRVPRLFARSEADDPREQNRVYRAYAEKETGTSLRASEVSRFWFAKGLAWASAHPGEWLWLLGRKALLFWNSTELWNNRSLEVSRQFSWVLRLPLLTFGVIVPLAFVGIVVTRRSYRRLLPLYGLIAVYFATGVLFFVLSRYRLPAVPALLVFAAAGVVWLWDCARARRFSAIAVAVLAIAASGWVVHRPIVVNDLSVAYYNVGNKFLARGDYGRAIGYYRQSLAINSSYLSAHNNLALALERSGTQREEAIRAWGRVLALGRRVGLDDYVEKALRHIGTLEAEPASAPARQ